MEWGTRNETNGSAIAPCTAFSGDRMVWHTGQALDWASIDPEVAIEHMSYALAELAQAVRELKGNPGPTTTAS